MRMTVFRFAHRRRSYPPTRYEKIYVEMYQVQLILK